MQVQHSHRHRAVSARSACRTKFLEPLSWSSSSAKLHYPIASLAQCDGCNEQREGTNYLLATVRAVAVVGGLGVVFHYILL